MSLNAIAHLQVILIFSFVDFEDHDFRGPWTADTKDPERIYASTYEKGKVSQACGASRYVFLDHPTFKMDLKRNTSYMV